jgi:long-chain acyl-CoA synthetase
MRWVERRLVPWKGRMLGPGDVLAVCAESAMAYVVLFLGALRAGLAVAPLAPSGTDAQLARMAED